MPLVISPAVRDKLRLKHGISPEEVEQAFDNRVGGVLRDTREMHQTDPPTLWFVSRTNRQRVLKVAYVQKGRDVYVKTAYEPKDGSRELYERLTKTTV